MQSSAGGEWQRKQRLCLFITAARPAYAGTEGCYRLLVFFISFFLFNESP